MPTPVAATGACSVEVLLQDFSGFLGRYRSGGDQASAKHPEESGVHRVSETAWAGRSVSHVSIVRSRNIGYSPEARQPVALLRDEATRERRYSRASVLR